VREEFLAAHDRFDSLQHAQAELDAWVADYNHHRPHRSLGMASPARRFHAHRDGGGMPTPGLPLRLPPGLAVVPAATPPPAPPPAVATSDLVAVEIDRVIPASGNMFAGGRQVWLGKQMAGQQVTIRLDRTTLQVLH
jgi:hypothetical protein